MKHNMFRMIGVVFIVATFALGIAGCGKKVVESEEAMQPESMEAVETGQVDMIDQAPMISEGIAAEEPLDSEPVELPVLTILEGRTSAPMLPIYFDYDKSNIRADQRERIEQNAAYLGDHPHAVARIEGNCDERGTNEYNMALGERRAQSAKKYLLNLGVAESRMETISYGEEMPLNYGHDELAWSQNRRDDFVIIK